MARSHLEWFLGVAAGADLDAGEYEERFSSGFRREVSPESFERQTEQLRAIGPFTREAVVELRPGAVVATLVAEGGDRWRVELVVDADGRIAGLVARPDPSREDRPSTVGEAADRLEELGDAALLAATVDERGTCRPIHERNADAQVPIGSLFKLYVLGALADAVAAGDLAWEQELTLRAADRSIGVGGLADRPDGARVTVREVAELMIAMSDNTATDLLMRTVGRVAVERALIDYGHAEPGRNIPFPTTREMTLLKLDAAAARRWLEGDVAARRAVLEGLAEGDLDADRAMAAFSSPRRPDVLEWFASPRDLCRVLVALWAGAEDPKLAPVADILTANPGQPDVAGRWARIAFKGGSEPGLVAAAWLVETGGSRAVLAASVLDPAAPIDPVEALLLMAAARDLLPAGG